MTEAALTLVHVSVLQKLKEFLDGRSLITKLEAEHDLIEKTLGESECPSCRPSVYISICVNAKISLLEVNAYTSVRRNDLNLDDNPNLCIWKGRSLGPPYVDAVLECWGGGGFLQVKCVSTTRQEKASESFPGFIWIHFLVCRFYYVWVFFHS